MFCVCRTRTLVASASVLHKHQELHKTIKAFDAIQDHNRDITATFAPLPPLSPRCCAFIINMPTVDEVQEALKANLAATDVVVLDVSGGCGQSYEVAVVSAHFEGKRLIERHRLVSHLCCCCTVQTPNTRTHTCHTQINAALKELMPEIHALSIKRAWTPEQQQQQTGGTS